MHVTEGITRCELIKLFLGANTGEHLNTTNIHVYNNWFSKLIPIIDKDAKTIELKAPNFFIQEDIIKRYGDTIKKIVNELGIKFKGIDRHER